jgi:hypothetical protein
MGAAEKLMTPGSQGDVAIFTGAHTRDRQKRTLAKNGIPHTINAAGWPVVAWAAVEGAPQAEKPLTWTPGKVT